MNAVGEEFGALTAVAGPVSRETFDRLKRFEAEFRKWNRRINLAAPSTLANLWNRHVIDSAQLLTLDREALKWVDLGSGGGFPGAIMAILLRERANAQVFLVESNRKKAAFLQTVLAGLEAPARVLAIRIEDAARAVGPVDIVTARALAPLEALLDLAAPWLEKGSKGLFHKGRGYRDEIENSRVAWRYDLVEHPSAVDREGAILEISNLQRLAR